MVAAAATGVVIFAAGPVQADLGDTVGVVSTTTGQVVKPPVDAVVKPVKKVVAPAPTRVVAPVVAPVVKRTVTRTVTRAVAPVTRTVAPVTAPVTRTTARRPTTTSTDSGSRQTAAPRTSTSGTAPKAAGPAHGTAPRAGHKPAARAAAARGGATRANAVRPERQPFAHVVLTLNRAAVTEPVPLLRPVAHHAVGTVSNEDLRLPQGCLTPSFDLDELRRCAFAVRLGGTGGVLFGLLPTGMSLVLTGALMVVWNRRWARRTVVL